MDIQLLFTWTEGHNLVHISHKFFGRSCIKGYELPKDTVKDRLIVDFHLYTKSAGTYKQVVNKIYDKYVNKGIPAILSEYNLDPVNNKYDDNSAKYLSEWVAYARERGISCAIWDNNDVAYKIIDRASVKWTQEEIAKAVVKAGAPAMNNSSSSSSSSSSSDAEKLKNVSSSATSFNAVPANDTEMFAS